VKPEDQAQVGEDRAQVGEDRAQVGEDRAQVGEDRAQVGIVTGAGRGMGLACARRPRPWTRWALSQRPA